MVSQLVYLTNNLIFLSIKPFTMDHTVSVGSVHINFTPYALARLSNAIYNTTLHYDDDAPIGEYLLWCISIELGLKAAILSKNNSKSRQKKNKNEIGHDLIKAGEAFHVKFGYKLFDKKDIQALNQINPYFKNKSMEYFEIETIVALMKGLSTFPDLNNIKTVATKVNKFLSENKYFVDLH